MRYAARQRGRHHEPETLRHDLPDNPRTERALAMETAPIVVAEWAERHFDAATALCRASVSKIMWNMRRHLNPDVLPSRRVFIQFRFTDPGLEYGT